MKTTECVLQLHAYVPHNSIHIIWRSRQDVWMIAGLWRDIYIYTCTHTHIYIYVCVYVYSVYIYTYIYMNKNVARLGRQWQVRQIRSSVPRDEANIEPLW